MVKGLEKMVSEEERRKILELVATGKITADEAATLLSGGAVASAAEALQSDESAGTPPKVAPDTAVTESATVPAKESSGRQPSWLHVKVSDLRSGQRKVSVNIPLRLLKVGMRLGSGFAPELRDVDWDELNSALASGQEGILIDVEDEEDGEHVQIYVD